MKTLRGLAMLATAALAAVSAVAAGPWVAIMTPRDGEMVIGEVEVSVEAGSEQPIVMVEFLIDGRPAGSLSQPPFRLVLDLGDDNLPHTIEAVVTDASGVEARATVTTAPVPIAAEFAVELQQLYITATRDGDRVLDLGQESFTVKDDGQQQEIVTFARGDLPFTASLLIDASASMRGPKLAAAVAGAQAFLGGMQSLDQAQLTVFSDSLLIHTPIGAGREVMLAGLGWVEAQGGTAIADHLWTSLKLLEARQGRRVAVLLSDGVDTHSVLRMSAVLEAARRCQALVYWIRLVRPQDDMDAPHEVRISSAWRGPADYREQHSILEQLVTESGGRVIDVRSPAGIEPVFLAILEELREQYVIGYYPTNRRNDGQWHDIEVHVDRGGVDLRYASGYIDY